MKEKKLAFLIFVFGLLLVFTGVSYSFFNFNKEGVRNSELIAGDIYMHYNESNTLTIQNAMPQKNVPLLKSFDYYEKNNNPTSEEVLTCTNLVSDFFEQEEGINIEEMLSQTGENLTDFCAGTGTIVGMDINTMIEQSYSNPSMLDFLDILLQSNIVRINTFKYYGNLVRNENMTQSEIEECMDYSPVLFGPVVIPTSTSYFPNYYYLEKTDLLISNKNTNFNNGKIQFLDAAPSLGELLYDFCSSNNNIKFERDFSPLFRYKNLVVELYNKNIIKSDIDINELLSKYSYFEFTIDGKNTSIDKDIWYEVSLTHGDSHDVRTERIRDDLLKFRLVEVVNNQENELINNVSFNDLTNQKIWVDTINKNTSSMAKTYRLYMWIVNNAKICGGDIIDNCDYYLDNTPSWSDVYASIKVNVNGDFIKKDLPYSYMAEENGIYCFWPSSINNVKSNITEVNFINLTESEIIQRYQIAPIKGDVTDIKKGGGNVLVWLEVDNLDNTKYKMYVAGNKIIYFPKSTNNMFEGFSSLKTINFDDINTSQMIDMSQMFYGCSSLTSLDVSNFDTSQVTDMYSMFYGCNSLISLDVSNFDTSQVTDMYSMFYGCNSLISLDVSNFDTSQVTDMSGMFYGCSSLTSLDVSNFNTSQATYMKWMFGDCGNLISLDLSNFDTSNVIDMIQMFYGCSSLTSLDISDFNLSNNNTTLILFDGMFSDILATCQVKVRDIDAQNWVLTANNAWSTSNVIIKS